MRLLELLKDIPYTVIKGDVSCEIAALTYDSRKATEGCAFVCLSGAVQDGHDFIPEAVRRGAAAVIVEKNAALKKNIAPAGTTHLREVASDREPAAEGERDAEPKAAVTVIQVENTRRALALMSAAWFGHPAGKLITVGVTGTKGKTTTTYMIKSILEKAGVRVGLIGTIEVLLAGKSIPSVNTTPESYDLQAYFARMAKAGIQVVVMEVSSQGLMLCRVGGFTFDYGIFTNLEPDHIGDHEHKDFEDYKRCKSLLFRQCRVGILNSDSPYFGEMIKNAVCKVETFGYGEEAGLRASAATLLRLPGMVGVRFHVSGPVDMDVTVNVPGKFSVYNALAALALCLHFKVREKDIKEALLGVRVKGRIELAEVPGEYTLMIDYAHNALALRSLLFTLREYRPSRLVCMFGCGGDRDRNRRFEMGEAAARLSDLVVVTSDNPRFEEPERIMEDIVAGVEKADGAYVVIKDRREAIAYCIGHAQPGDIIVLAGKGHEEYQEICGVKYPMDERKLIGELLAAEAEHERKESVMPEKKPNMKGKSR